MNDRPLPAKIFGAVLGVWRFAVKHARSSAFRGLALAIMFWLGIASGRAESYSATFPGTRSELPSPDDRMSVVNRDPEDKDGKHVLLLKSATDPKERQIHEYRRHVSVAWSPSSKFLTITDYTESTDATCSLYDVKSAVKTDLAMEAVRANQIIARLMANTHAYFACARWRNPSRVLIKIDAWGGDNSSGKTRFFEYTVGNGFRKANEDGAGWGSRAK